MIALVGVNDQRSDPYLESLDPDFDVRFQRRVLAVEVHGQSLISVATDVVLKRLVGREALHIDGPVDDEVSHVIRLVELHQDVVLRRPCADKPSGFLHDRSACRARRQSRGCHISRLPWTQYSVPKGIQPRGSGFLANGLCSTSIAGFEYADEKGFTDARTMALMCS